MYKVSNLRLPIGFDDIAVRSAIGSFFGLNAGDILSYEFIKLSLDCRKKSDIKYIASIAFDTKKSLHNAETYFKAAEYRFKKAVSIPKNRPVIIGFGPAGIFMALVLAKAGLNPIVLERGMAVSGRIKAIEDFKNLKILNPDTNVQFGEGGAGTFSDGKLTTGTKDIRNYFVKQTFVKFGAQKDILYSNKPHIGTDYLVRIIPNIRREIEMLGGEVLFEHKAVDFEIKHNKIAAVLAINKGKTIRLETDDVALAVGHSARDVFERLKMLGVNMEQKAFSIGVRAEHLQKTINLSQYGVEEGLPSADYKLACHLDNGRSVYTFCMCPGGEVVNAASEEGMSVTNGMSNYDRANTNANSATLVNVLPSDFGSDDILAGVEFQRKYERLAYELAGSNYNLPCQRMTDFCLDRASTELKTVVPSCSPNYTLCNINDCLPGFVAESLKQGYKQFGKIIQNFYSDDAILLGVETRTSSPVRILRNDDFQSNIAGIYPVGEGAGYAGGIMSAAVDGIKTAEKILDKYC